MGRSLGVVNVLSSTPFSSFGRIESSSNCGSEMRALDKRVFVRISGESAPVIVGSPSERDAQHEVHV